jgi:type I restriction enzyme S subunit
MSGATREKITQEAMNGIIVPVPPKFEQEELVRSLDASLCVQRELEHSIGTQLALLSERRQALITAAVTGQMDVTTARRGSA